jgi:hypothetical protein
MWAVLHILYSLVAIGAERIGPAGRRKGMRHRASRDDRTPRDRLYRSRAPRP